MDGTQNDEDENASRPRGPMPPPPSYEDVIRSEHRFGHRGGASARLPGGAPIATDEQWSSVEDLDDVQPKSDDRPSTQQQGNENSRSGFSAVLVRSPKGPEHAKVPAESHEVEANAHKLHQPRSDAYISRVDTLGPEATEMARFLPQVSPDDITLEPTTLPVRMAEAEDDVMETCLDDAEPNAAPERKADTIVRRPSYEVARQVVADVESGGETRDERPCFTRFLALLKKPTEKCIILSVFIILAVVVFLGVFPPSFVYLDYGHVALKRTKSTGYVNTEDVIYPGCYVLGPDVEFKIFNSTAITMNFPNVGCFLRDQMEISFECNLQYFIRPESVGKLHNMFDMEFEPVLKKLAFSTLKNTATEFSLSDIRLNRSYVEKKLHMDLQQKLGGDCCPVCCEAACPSHPSCNGCNSDRWSCSPGYHVDVRYFNFGAVSLPWEVTTRLLRGALLHVKAETEVFRQNYALAKKETERQVSLVTNEAAEIKNRAEVKADYITRIAKAKSLAQKSIVDMEGLRDMCANLGVTDQDQKLSVYMFKTFNNMDNLYMAPGWGNKSSVYAGGSR